MTTASAFGTFASEGQREIVHDCPVKDAMFSFEFVPLSYEMRLHFQKLARLTPGPACMRHQSWEVYAQPFAPQQAHL